MPNILRTATVPLLAIALVLAACTDQPMPVEVSERFWEAVQNDDVNSIRRMVTAESVRDTIRTGDLLDIGAVTLGRTVIDGDSAWVDTTVTISADRPFTIPIRTVLQLERRQWRVDYGATMADLSRGGQVSKVFDDIRQLGEGISGQMDQALDELERALPEVQQELKKLEEQLRSRLPELQRRLEDFARELENAIRKTPQQPSDAPEQPIKT